jgi:ABC-type multidrug transport system fused ATPase/permease subunit
MNIIWKLRRYLKKYAREYIVAIIALQTVAVLNLVPFWLIGRVVDEISEGSLTSSVLTINLAGILVSGFVMYALRYAWQNKLYGASIAITRELRRDLFRKLSTLPPSFYSRRSTGDLMAHATNDLNALEETTGMGIMTMVDSLIAGLTVILGMIFVVSGELTAVALLPFPILVYITRRYGANLHKAFSLAQASFSNLNEETRETIVGIRAVRSHGIKQRQEQRFSKTLDETLAANLSVAKLDAAFAPTIQVVYGLSFVISLSYGAWLINQGSLSVGLFTTFTLYLTQLLGPFMQFGWQFNVFQRGSTSWQRLESIFSEQNIIVEGKNTLPNKTELSLQVNIHAYKHHKESVHELQDIKFTVHAKGLVGITGPTGGGKSTLLQLILRQFSLQKPSNISIGGHLIEDLSFDSLRSQIAWVPQKPFLFSGTITENIMFGNPTATKTDIKWVADVVGMKAEIDAMSEGFNTKLTEGANNLSGGQKQRLTLARALLTGAGILLLDDPFSALDMKTEMIVRQNLKKYYGHKTMLLVSQRLPNLIEADHIIVLEDGHIIERGNHFELMSHQGWYSKVFKRQSQLDKPLPAQKGKYTQEKDTIQPAGEYYA